MRRLDDDGGVAAARSDGQPSGRAAARAGSGRGEQRRGRATREWRRQV
jgi:hypothetical protein